MPVEMVILAADESGGNIQSFDVGKVAIMGFTTPVAQLEAVRTSEPINLGWARACSLTRSQACTDDGDCPPEENCIQVSPRLSIKHQISLVDSRTQSPPGRSVERGVVQVQLADAAGDPVGDWIKLDPYTNLYDKQAADTFTNCMFDPIDDGNDEDSFFDPTDPLRRLGPTSTCFPEFSFAWQGETANPFDAENLGCCFYDVWNVDTGGHPVEGPGLEGVTGLPTRRRLSNAGRLVSLVPGSFALTQNRGHARDQPIPIKRRTGINLRCLHVIVTKHAAEQLHFACTQHRTPEISARHARHGCRRHDSYHRPRRAQYRASPDLRERAHQTRQPRRPQRVNHGAAKGHVGPVIEIIRNGDS